MPQGTSTLLFTRNLTQSTYPAPIAYPELRFDQPLGLATPPNETNRLFVAEKIGRIQVITNLAQPNLTTFLDLSSKVFQGGESGLLGLTFHPGYSSNHWFFVTYTLVDAGGSVKFRLSRFATSSADPNRAEPGSELVLFAQTDEDSTHEGGDLHFGPDGYLYRFPGG